MSEHPDLDRAWREFRRDDAAVTAPPRLRQSVMAAWDAAQRGRADVRARGVPWPAIGAVAAAALTIVTAVALREGARPLDDARSEEAMPGEPSGSEMPGLRLVSEPAFDGEPLDVVRLRMPSASLAALGITLAEADASRLVDVEVVVGSDGLARAIRSVRLTAQDADLR